MVLCAYPYFLFSGTEDKVEDQDESSLRSSFAIIKLDHLRAL